MTYYADLTPYTYDESDRDRLNVGWLDNGHPFPAGPADEELGEALAHLLRFQVNVTRGMQPCVFCDRRFVEFTDGDGNTCLLGAGEIHVDGEDGAAFASPSLIVHYVTEHGYRPPEAFRRAALEYARYYGHGMPSTAPGGR
ncbi:MULTISPECIES: hypothetical protein [unclassified Streptomyces]|uniref:DUF7919 family protein n=1 Tax=unclassified Streptomyces TaxID=2593676 RepID=UPI003401EBEC